MITKSDINFWVTKLKDNEEDIIPYYIYYKDETKETINIRIKKYYKHKYNSYISVEDNSTYNKDKEYTLLINASKINTINKIYEVMKRIIKAN